MRDPKYNYNRYIEKLANQLGQDKYADDLFQEGLIGLWQAEKRYNESKGTFHSIARSYIKFRMLTWLTNNSRTIRLPANIVNDGTVHNKMLSTSMVLSDDTSTTLEDVLASPTFESFDGYIFDNHQDDSDLLKLNRLKTNVSKLKPDYQKVIRMFYWEDMTLKAIGDKLGITKEAVRQKKECALKKLREM